MTRFIGIAAVAGALFAIGLVGAGGAAATTVCTWAGTPAEPTGTFSITPGVTDIPSAGPLKFKATGKVSGGGRCRGTMTFDGQMDAGATCPWSDFEGRVKGMPGVARFHGKGSLLVPSILYDENGNVVGEENAQIVTQSSFAHATACTTPQGFTGGWPGMFSSVFELFD